MSVHLKRASYSGFTIIEVVLFLAVSGFLLMVVLGSASVGVNTQRYRDSVNTLAATVQQEFTNVTNPINTKSVDNMCEGSTDAEEPRGISNCVIIGRLMTIADDGAITESNLIGAEPAVEFDEDEPEAEVIRAYEPKIDTATQEAETISWGANLEFGNPPSSATASILILRSPRSGNIYSYVFSNVIGSDSQLEASLNALPSREDAHYLCVSRTSLIATPAQAVKIAPFASGPSGVSVVNVEGGICQ
jgi:hypothetical protein